MSQERIKEALGYLLSNQSAKGFEVLNSVMESKTMEALQDQMVKVGKEVFGEGTIDEGYPSRKHFQQVADTLKHVEDPKKREELAKHHAGIFKAQNDRFDHGKFYKAAGVGHLTEDTQKKSLDEGVSHEVGHRVELHPATDAWMKGDQHGTVTKKTETHSVVKMDKSGKSLKVHPDNVYRNHTTKMVSEEELIEVEIKHDGFARTSTNRNLVSSSKGCSNCGQTPKSGKLKQYSTKGDDNNRPGPGNVHKGLFCSKSCHDQYHG